MDNNFVQGVGNLLVTFALLPVMGFAGVWLMSRMVQGDLEVLPGIVTFFVMILLVGVALFFPHQQMAGPVLVVTLAAMAFFPFAETQLEKFDMVTIDIDRIERAHQALARQPDNVTARFELARALWDRGLQGHAIALAENTLGGLSTERDLMSMQSLRDKFFTEDREVQRWRREVTDPRAFEPLTCPKCGNQNEPGLAVCSRCGGPYLLELARKNRGKQRIYARLTVGFALTTTLLVSGAWVGLNLPWPGSGICILALLVGIGLTMAWLFRPKTMRE